MDGLYYSTRISKSNSKYVEGFYFNSERYSVVIVYGEEQIVPYYIERKSSSELHTEMYLL